MDPGGGVTVGNGVTVGKDVVGNMRTVALAGNDTDPIRVNINSQDSAMLEGSYTRNRALDVAGYKAYTHQETGSNRMLVALVSDRLSSAKGVVAVDGAGASCVGMGVGAGAGEAVTAAPLDAGRLPSYIADHRKRLRERFRDGGPGAVAEYELLELLLLLHLHVGIAAEPSSLLSFGQNHLHSPHYSQNM